MDHHSFLSDGLLNTRFIIAVFTPKKKVGDLCFKLLKLAIIINSFYVEIHS